MYRWIEHTGEQELEVEAATEEDVFLEALEAFHDLQDALEGERRSISIRLTGGDRAALLVDFVNELVFLAETEGFVADQFADIQLSDGGLRATLEGATGSPRHLVKAVTWHRVRFHRDGEVYRAGVVLDV